MQMFLKVNLIFLMMMMTIVSVSMTYFLMIWVFMEISTLLFIFFNSCSSPNLNNFSLKYFMTQSFISILLVLTFIFFRDVSVMKSFIMGLLLMWKLGLPPMHFWFMNLVMDLDWLSFLLISTVMKFSPLFLISVYYSDLVLLMSFISVMVSSMAGASQACLKKIMAYSSIFTSGWILISMSQESNSWPVIFLAYSLMLSSLVYSYFHSSGQDIDFGMSEMSTTATMSTFLIFLSLSGIPPFSGFFIKLYIVLNILSSGWLALSFLIVMISVFSIYMYLKIMFKYMTFLSLEFSFNKIEMTKLNPLILSGLFSGLLLLMVYM